jgi:hypothetical protein
MQDMGVERDSIAGGWCIIIDHANSNTPIKETGNSFLQIQINLVDPSWAKRLTDDIPSHPSHGARIIPSRDTG